MEPATGPVLGQVTAIYLGKNVSGDAAAQWTVDVRTPGGRLITAPVYGSRVPKAAGWVLIFWLNEHDAAPIALPVPSVDALQGHAGHERIDDYDSGIQIRVTTGGQLHINAASGRAIAVSDGPNDKPLVELAGGGARAAREGDTVDANDALATWMAWIDAALLAVAAAAGAVIPPSPGVPLTTGLISSGSDNVDLG